MENISFFDTVATEMPTEKSVESKLDVAQMKFLGANKISWQELFSGFDELRAITFSSGIGFVCQLLEKFQKAEIIFGCDEVLSYSLQEVMAYQYQLVERMRETAGKMKMDLISRIGDGSLRFYVARDLLSHEKLYLLSAADGRKRVVMGSANMSFAAFSGRQRENICFLDDADAYDWYLDCYEALRENSTDQIGKDALLVADTTENLDKIPIASTVRQQKILVLQPVEEKKEEVRFTLDVKNLASKFASFVPKPDRKGKIMLSPDQFKVIRRQAMAEQAKENVLKKQYPQLEIFPEEKLVRLNGETLVLNPVREDVQRDVNLFLEYMAGFEAFHGDYARMQKRYFEFANWFFCSPFMAYMRDMAAQYDQNFLYYPVYGLIYGQSKAGKTSFLETLLKMMIGQKVKISAPEFTRTSIEGLKRTVRGAPIIVDDLTKRRFDDHAVETIKNEDFGIAEHLTQYPAVVISANEDVKVVKPEIARRTVICRVGAGLTTTEVMKSNVVRTVQRKIGTAFYREYLRRMLDVMPELVEKLQDPKSDHAPDILAYSSRILLDMFAEYTSQELPPYMRPLKLENYFNDRITAGYAMKTIRSAWKINPTSFEISTRANELRYNAGETWEADRILKELPENLEAYKSREWVVMKLDEAKNFFAVNFKKPWIHLKR